MSDLVRGSLRIAALGLLGLLTGCSPRPQPRPDLILIVVDTLRADYLGAYGFAHAVSPNLDAFAAQSVVFERAIAASSRTAPSHASLMTSRYVRQHSIRHVNGGSRLGDEVTLATLLRDAGYDTGAFVSNFLLRRTIGLDAGFDVYDDDLPDSEPGRPVIFERTAQPTTERALSWLAGRAERPYFLWVHYQDPHGPYRPPAPFDQAFRELENPSEAALPVLDQQRGEGGIPAYQALVGEVRPGQYRRRYAGEIAHVDAWLGRLLEAIAARGRETVILITADHGESMGEEGIYFSHGYATTPDLSRVPLILQGPGLAPGRRRELVHHVDVLPTLLELAGLPVPADASGVALGPYLRKGLPIPDRTVYCETQGEVGVYSGDHFVRVFSRRNPARAVGGAWRSYAWQPEAAWEPVAPDAALRAPITDYLRKAHPIRRLAREISEEDRARLQALGYVELEDEADAIGPPASRSAAPPTPGLEEPALPARASEPR